MVPPLEIIEGIMAVRQITWSKETEIMYFIKLTCFECRPEDVCEHHHLFSLTLKKETMNMKKPPARTKVVLKVSDV